MAFSDYSIVVCRRDGTAEGELQDTIPDSVSWELNTYGEMTFSIPNNHPKASLLQPLKREVQLWRVGDTRPLWWGVLVDEHTTPGHTNWRAHEIPWYFTKRFVGKADRSNLLPNGNMESPLAGAWTAVNTTMTRVTDFKFEGDYAMRLRQSTAGQSAYASRTFALPSGAHVYFVAGWFHIPHGSPYPFGSAQYNYGLMARLIRPGSVFLSKAGYPIGPDQGHKVGESYRAEFSIVTPPGFTGSMEIRLYSPRGDIIWDAVTVTRMESLSFRQTDLANILKGLAQHAQDPAYGKSSLNIDYNAPLTGVKADMAFQHADHQQILECMHSVTEMIHGCDFHFEYTRRKRTMVIDYPRKGTVKPKITFEYYESGNGNLSRYEYQVDGKDTANAIITLGEGDGPDREEGYARDTSGLEGLVLEAVESASNYSIGYLDQRAANILAKKKNPVQILSVTTQEDTYALLDKLFVGDEVNVKIVDGDIFINSVFRIIKIDLAPQSSELTLIFNER
jgi:hypothetical protein